MAEHTQEVFSNKFGTTNAVVCSCGFATTYTVIMNEPDKMGLEHFRRMHEAHIARTSARELPIIPEGAKVIVDHPRYHGPGIVSFDSAIHKRYVAVTLGNGNTWHYERDTVRLAD